MQKNCIILKFRIFYPPSYLSYSHVYSILSNLYLSLTEGALTCTNMPNGHIFYDSTNCQNFYICAHGTAFLKKCADSLMFDHTQNACEWANKVDCTRGHGSVQPSTATTTKRTTTSTTTPVAFTTTTKQSTTSTSTPVASTTRFPKTTIKPTSSPQRE